MHTYIRTYGHTYRGDYNSWSSAEINRDDQSVQGIGHLTD